MKDTAKLGRIINSLRLKNDMSLRDLASKSGVSYSFISSIEHNRFKGSRETIIALAEALDGANKNKLLLLAGFAPEDDSETTIEDIKTIDNESKLGRAFLGGADKYSEEELDLARAAGKAAVDAYRKAQRKIDEGHK